MIYWTYPHNSPIYRKKRHVMKPHSSATYGAITLIISLGLSVTIANAQTEFFKHHPWPQLSKKTTVHSAAPQPKSMRLFSTTTHLDTATFTPYPANLTGVIVGNASWIDYDN